MPVTTVGGLNLFGVPLPEVVLIATLIYTVFLLLEKLPVVIERLKQFTAWVKGFKNEQGK